MSSLSYQPDRLSYDLSPEQQQFVAAVDARLQPVMERLRTDIAHSVGDTPLPAWVRPVTTAVQDVYQQPWVGLTFARLEQVSRYWREAIAHIMAVSSAGESGLVDFATYIAENQEMVHEAA